MNGRTLEDQELGHGSPHPRGNGWIFSNLTVDQRYVEIPPNQLLPQLSLANPLAARQRFLIPYQDITYLWELFDWSSGFSALDRKLLALLINHHALILRGRGERWFSPSRTLDNQFVDPFGVGTTAPRLWVLGEQGNARAKSFPLPFGTTAGSAMLWPFVHPWTTRISNCLQPQEKQPEARRRLRHQWHLLGEPPVLLLGNMAASMWTEASAVLGYLEHPQFIYRFHHSQCMNWTKQFVAFESQAGD